MAVFKYHPIERYMTAKEDYKNELTKGNKYKILEIFGIQCLVKNNEGRYKYYDALMFND